MNFKVQRRRRSSAFRPGNYSYPIKTRQNSLGIIETNDDIVTLETLPHSVLALIFSYLHTKDLKTLCLISKLTYLPAATHIYKKILVVPKPLIAKFFADYLQDVAVNFGSVIFPENIDTLCSVLSSSPKLCGRVKSIVLLHGSHDISSKLQSILPKVQLNELFVPQIFKPIGDTLTHIQRLGICSLSFTGSKVHLPNLRHLKIFYGDGTMSEFVYSMKESLKFLETLEFTSQIDEKYLPLQALNHANSAHLSSYEEPQWVQFFQTLRLISFSKLKLTSLALDGFIGQTGQHQAALLNATVHLESLRCLQLKITELTHGNSAHQDMQPPSTFLYYLSQLTPSLTKLAIASTHDCLLCQHQTLKLILGDILANKFTTLAIVLELPDYKSSREINTIIANHQTKLINLKIFNKSSYSHDKIELFRCLNGCKISTDLYEQSIYFDQSIQDILFPNYFLHEIENISTSISRDSDITESSTTYRRNSVIVNEYMIELIERITQNSVFTEYFQRYLSETNHDSQVRKLKNLQLLHINGFPLYVDDRKHIYLMKNYGDLFPCLVESS